MSWASTPLNPRGIGLEIGDQERGRLGLGLRPLPVVGLLSNSINLISFFRSNCCPAAAAANVPGKCTTKLRSNHVPNELPRSGGQALPRGGVAADCLTAAAAVHTSSEPRRPVSRLINHNGNWLPDSTFESFLKRNCIFDLASAWLLANQCHQSCAAGFPIFICLSTPTFLFVAFVVTFCSFICCFSSFFLLFSSLFFLEAAKASAKDSPIIAPVSQCRQLILRSGTEAPRSPLLRCFSWCLL